MFKNSQKGVSLIMTFFIMVIILGINFSISAILYSELKIMRNMGNSVLAFFVADSGIEKVLYYDRKVIPEGSVRGICDICTAPGAGVQCISGSPEGLDCAYPERCTNCRIIFESSIDEQRHYKEDIAVSQQCKINDIVANSYGFYKDASRAIQLNSLGKATVGWPPEIIDPEALYGCQPNGVNTTIQAIILDPDGTIEDVWAYITGEGDENYNQCYPHAEPCVYREIELHETANDIYEANWNFGRLGVVYTVIVVAYDNSGNCVQVNAGSIFCSS